jgi:aminoglycoside phosphotransferase (APT) family kinase protein
VTSPPGLDLEALAAYLGPRVGGLAGALRGEVIPGGRSNLTYIVDDGERRFVVRRPPLAHVLPTAHDMAREYRVLASLQGTGIPVPEVIALCEDDSVIGARFYVMEWIDGHVVRDALPGAFPDTPETRRAMSTALIDTLLQLHAIDPNAVGLSDFGHPDGFLARQVRRWWQQWEASKTRELPTIETLRRRLDETVPTPSAPGIVHGDYRLDNVMYAPADPSRIVAVIDWEMCTIGDPLCDVGLLCVYWADDESEAAARTLHGRAITVENGFAKRADLLRHYAAGTQRDLTSLDWYIALGAYKLAIIAEGITARFLMGMTVGEGFETMGEMVPAIVESGLVALDKLGAAQGG